MKQLIYSIFKPYNAICVLFCVALGLTLAMIVVREEYSRKLCNEISCLCFKNGYANKKLRVFLSAVILASWCTIAFLLFYVLGVPIANIVKVIAYLIFYLVLPGYLIVRKIKTLPHVSLLYALCFACGMGIMFFVYLLGTFSGNMSIVRYLPFAFSLLGLGLLYIDIKNGNIKRGLLQIDLSLLSLTSVLVAYAILSRAVCSSPAVSGSGSTFMDSLYIVSNTAAMKNGLFQDSFLFPGFLLRYHSMTNIQQACACLATGISAVDLFVIYWPLIYLGASVASINGLVTILRKSSVGAGRITALVFFSQTFTVNIFYLFNTTKIDKHLYTGIPNLEAYLLRLPNGNDIAIPLILCICSVCILHYRNECRKRMSFVLIALLVGLCTGAKATYSVCVIATLAVTLVLLAVLKRSAYDIKSDLLLLGAAIIGFSIVYVLLIYNPNQSAVSTVSVFNPYDSRSSLKGEKLFWYLKHFLMQLFPKKNVSDTLVLLLEFPLSLFSILPYTIIPFFISFKEKLLCIKTVQSEHMLVYGISISALLLYYSVNIDGYSQIYFLLSGLCLIHILGQIWIEKNYNRFHRVVKAFFILCLIISLFSTGVSMNAYGYRAAVDYVSGNVKSGVIPDPTYDSITAYETDAMLWLRDNSSKDSLIVTDRLLNAPQGSRTIFEAIDDALYFYYPAYSERQFFISGFSYAPRTEELEEWTLERLQVIEKLYDENTVNRAKILNQYGITHIVVSSFTTPNLDLSEDSSVRCVYSNRDIRIYTCV